MSRGLGARASSHRPSSPLAADLASRRVYPVAALLLALASAMGPLAHNLHQASPADAVPALIGTTVFAACLWLVAVAFRRRADAGAALVACVWVIGSLYYLELVRHLNAALGGDYTMIRPLPFALVVMVGLTIALRGARRWHAPAHTVLASIAVAVLAVPVWHTAAYEWRNGAARRAYDPDRAMAEMPQLARAEAAAAAAPPDIYHFVFDRYGSEETLARHFGVRDPIGAWLESRGFYVARDSFSNYMSTGPSLASTFHMDYLDALAADPRVKGSNWHPIFRMLDDNRVGRFLRARGYEHHQFGSWWVGTYHNPNAFSNRPLGFSEFNMTYLRRTMLMPVFHLAAGLADRDAPRLGQRAVPARRPPARGDQAAAPGRAAPSTSSPTSWCRTSPTSSRPTGAASPARIRRPRPDAGLRRAGRLRRRDHPGRGDGAPGGGPASAGRPDPGRRGTDPRAPAPSVPWQDASEEELRIKFGILNAFYFPGADYSRLRNDITPVNSYRVLLGAVFGVDLPDLPDRMLAFPDDRSIYDFHDVTERVRCTAREGSSLRERKAQPC